MAMLQNAKKQKEQDKGDDSGAKSSEPKKHKKHKAPPSAAPVDNAPPDDSGDSGQPDQDAEQPEQGDDSQGASSSSDGGDQSPGGADAEGDAGAQAQPQPNAPQQQAATPVPNPAAPGAGDDTSGGEDTPPNADAATGGTPNEGTPSPAGSPSAQGGPASSSMSQVPMSPALKEAYQALDKELVTQLYQNGIAEHILPSLFPQGPHKIKALVMTSVTLARELFVKANAPIQLALPFGRDVAAHIMQIGEQVKQIQYSDQEAAAIFGAVYEGILHAFGVKKSQFHTAASVIPRSQLAKHASNYFAAHKYAQGAHAANNAQPHAQDVAETQPQGPPAGAAGPQGPQGAPPAQPQGGALSQGAAASEQPQEQGEEQS